MRLSSQVADAECSLVNGVWTANRSNVTYGASVLDLKIGGILPRTGVLSPFAASGERSYLRELPSALPDTVTDDDLGSSQDTLIVNVGNVRPSVAAGLDQTVNEGDTVKVSFDPEKKRLKFSAERSESAKPDEEEATAGAAAGNPGDSAAGA